MDFLHRAKLLWGQLRQLARIEAREDEWRLFMKIRADGSTLVTLVNFADGFHRHVEGGHVCESTLAFLRRNRVQLESIRLAGVVGCAGERLGEDWENSRSCAL